MTTAFIGLGSNLNNPLQQVTLAITELQRLPKTTLLQSSSLYKTPPLGPANQPDFINAVVVVDTLLSPLELLAELQSIENAYGRERKLHWGPRTLDLDILLYGDEVINHDELVIPHPGIASREFVLYPLLEIVPELRLPTGEAIKELARRCYKVAQKMCENI